MARITRKQLRDAAKLVHAVMPPTPQYAWPLLKARLGVEVVVKHENHTPTGAFKVRGGIVYLDRMRRERPHVRGIVSATRGNHGQSLALAGARAGVPVTIVAPHGNAREKNAAMRAFGAELIEHGEDFEAARSLLPQLAEERGYEIVPSFHPDLVQGVASYALELFTAFPDLHTVYVPVGLGSGICGLIAVRDALRLKTEIVGVVSENADAYARSMEQGEIIATDSSRTFADGIATRQPDADAFEIIKAGAARIVRVSDPEVAEAIRVYHEDTHNLAEGAGAAPLAALARELRNSSVDFPEGARVGVILCGGNIDRGVAARVLAGETPEPA